LYKQILIKLNKDFVKKNPIDLFWNMCTFLSYTFKPKNYHFLRQCTCISKDIHILRSLSLVFQSVTVLHAFSKNIQLKQSQNFLRQGEIKVSPIRNICCYFAL